MSFLIPARYDDGSEAGDKQHEQNHNYNGIAAIVAACLIFTVRTLSVRYNWSLPRFK